MGSFIAYKILRKPIPVGTGRPLISREKEALRRLGLRVPTKAVVVQRSGSPYHGVIYQPAGEDGLSSLDIRVAMQPGK